MNRLLHLLCGATITNSRTRYPPQIACFFSSASEDPLERPAKPAFR